jgi:quinol monooxygenase YgiN
MNTRQSSDNCFVVIAEFLVKADKLDAFLAHALDDARSSQATEPGCLQFDVLRSPDHPRRVVFYEVYRSRQAFNDHLNTPHVGRFRNILADHVETEEPVRMLHRV